MWIPFEDLANQAEDDRIRQIGQKAMQDRIVIGFITDDEPDKAERYIRKLKARFPGIRIIDQKPGPVAKTVIVRVGPPVN